MNTDKIKTGLQDLIYRLQDAEKGYQEIIKASSNTIVNKWLKKYAAERHSMHQDLESIISRMGGKPEVDTTFLGALHRVFIDIKINNTSAENEFDAIVSEIERGAKVLIDDYKKVLAEIEMPADIVTTLMDQKMLVHNELSSLLNLKKEMSVPA